MTDLLTHRLATEGLDSVLAKTNTDRQTEFWLSPEGKWYNVPSCDHEFFAKFVAERLYHYDKYSDTGTATQVLIEHHWLIGRKITITQKRGCYPPKIKTEPSLCLTNCDGDLDIVMTYEQYKALYEFYESHGHKPVYRGWTISMLWQKGRKANKSKVKQIWEDLHKTKDGCCMATFDQIRPILQRAKAYFEETDQKAIAKWIWSIILQDADGRMEWRNVQIILYLEVDMNIGLREDSPAFELRRKILQKWQTKKCPDCDSRGGNIEPDDIKGSKWVKCTRCQGTGEVENAEAD